MSLENDALLGTLRSQRRHVLGILDGLSDEDLHRPVLPSGWSCLGLVRHLALDVERFWFRRVLLGEEIDLDDPATGGPDGWQVSPEATGSAVALDLYRRETESRTRWSPGRPRTSRRPGGRTSSATSGWTTCGRSRCT